MLTQAEADALIAMGKNFINIAAITLPPGTDETHELIGDDKRELFLLDLWRSTFRLSKLRHQTRGRKVIVLVRLCIDGSPHTNPDGEKIAGSHIHFYREGFEDRWAFPLNPNEFSAPSNIGQTFVDFCHFCNIRDIPVYQEGLL